MGEARYERVYTIEFHLNKSEKRQNKFMVKEVRIMVTPGIRYPCVVLEIVYILIQKVVIHRYTFIHIYVYICLYLTLIDLYTLICVLYCIVLLQ